MPDTDKTQLPQADHATRAEAVQGKKPYRSPRILSSEPLEATAAGGCDDPGLGKTSAPPFLCGTIDPLGS